MVTLLYVDDEPALLEIGKLFLESQEDFQVETLPSAKLALERLGCTQRYDAILSDYQMPEMDGIEFLKEVRRKYGEVPFILFTGKGREEIVIQAINNGADFYVQKGGEPKSQFAELAHHIRAAIERRTAIDSLRHSEQRLADIIDFSPNPMFAIDKKGEVILWNKAIAELTGVPSDRMLGKGEYEYGYALYRRRRPMLADLILAEDAAFEKEHYLYTLCENRTLTAEAILTKDDGTEIHLWGKASRLYEPSGDCAGAIETLTDITRLKETEAKLKKAYDQQTRILEEFQKRAALTRENYQSVLRSDAPETSHEACPDRLSQKKPARSPRHPQKE
ncbi:response regulator [Methanoregula sp. UBA64]|jgi:PAS domain S-box-containing protein|uniref:response regulator n=1 Tax=Methanoregula sp. UBA64 TaxID=1915554 RepID=UPI0025FD3764|nr:response regulator [Methanoregula sp. UBA64]